MIKITYKLGKYSFMVKATTGATIDDFLNDIISCKIDAFLYERELYNKTVLYQPKRQKFSDYILGKRPEPFKAEFDVRSIIEDTSAIEGERLHYAVNVLENE